MILVDTSVWIDFFSGRNLPHVATLEQFIQENNDLALCGIIMTEILQVSQTIQVTGAYSVTLIR